MLKAVEMPVGQGLEQMKKDFIRFWCELSVENR
jgi:hypothetical protein